MMKTMKNEKKLLLLALFGAATALAFAAATTADLARAPVEVVNDDGCGDDDNEEGDPPGDADTMPSTIVKART